MKPYTADPADAEVPVLKITMAHSCSVVAVCSPESSLHSALDTMDDIDDTGRAPFSLAFFFLFLCVRVYYRCSAPEVPHAEGLRQCQMC